VPRRHAGGVPAGLPGESVWSSAGDTIPGAGSKGSIWEWSIRDRKHRRVIETTQDAGLNALEVLPDGRLLLFASLSPGIRLELFDPAAGAGRVVLVDEAYAAELSPDKKSLCLNRDRSEADLWLARREGPRR
jgi:hypothetical protein